MSKYTVLLTIGVILPGLLAACAQPAVPDKPTGKVVVWGAFGITSDVLKASGIVGDFRAEYPDIEVEIVDYRLGDMYDNLNAALTEGQGGPDVCLMQDESATSLAQQGALLDLSEYIQPYLDDLVDYENYDCWANGKYYCVPMDASPVVMYYRRDVFEAAGLPTDPEEVSATIATWGDYLEACRVIKQETGHYCFTHSKAESYGVLYWILLSQQGLGYYDPQIGEVTVDSPENIATLEMLGRFWEEDLISDSLEFWPAWYAELGSLDRPVATVIMPSWWMEGYGKPRFGSATSGKWGVAYIPAVQSGGARVASLEDYQAGNIFVVPRQTQNPDAAWAFVQFVMTRRESQLKMLAANRFIPSLRSVYDDSAFERGDPFFAGQNVRRIYVDVNSSLPHSDFDSTPSFVYTAVNKAIHQYALGHATAADALQEAADESRSRLDQQ